MRVEVQEGQDRASGPRERRRRGESCPPHGPHAVQVAERGHYVARCLACGLAGPESEDSLEAKLAFDQRWN
jgi:hypothetical protein